jgi:uncharacterized metal-binding protein YceD (DUF177 family)
MSPEFSRPLSVERVGPTGTEVVIEASAEERGALAERFGIPGIDALSARFVAKPWRRGGVELRGDIFAVVEQVSVVSLEPFTSELAESVVRYFQAETGPGHRPAVLSVQSLEEDEPDIIEGGSIDLGEIAAETLALALDPYPRIPGEEFQGGPEQPDAEQQRESPFAVLSRLKKP